MKSSFVFGVLFLSLSSIASVPKPICPDLAGSYLCHDETDSPEWELTLTQELDPNGNTVYANESRTAVLISDGVVHTKSEPGVTVDTKSWCEKGQLHVENHTKLYLEGESLEYKDHSINFRGENDEYISEMYDEDKFYQSVLCWPVEK